MRECPVTYKSKLIQREYSSVSVIRTQVRLTDPGRNFQNTRQYSHHITSCFSLCDSGRLSSSVDLQTTHIVLHLIYFYHSPRFLSNQPIYPGQAESPKITKNRCGLLVQIFIGLQAGCTTCQPTNGVKALKRKITFCRLAHPKLTWGLPTLTLMKNSSRLPWGRVAMPLISPMQACIWPLSIFFISFH